MINLIVNDKQDYLWAGVGTVAGWGITSFGDPSSCGTSFLETPEHFPNILQETTMSMCFEDEAAAYPLSDNQLCAVDTLSYPYEVCISACNKTNFWFQGSCLLVSWAWEILERPFITVFIPFSLQTDISGWRRWSNFPKERWSARPGRGCQLHSFKELC